MCNGEVSSRVGARKIGKFVMKSLNQRWERSWFHNRIAEISGVVPGATVVDLGCGVGKTLGPLLEATGPDGLVIGVDISEKFLAGAAERYPEMIAGDRLRLVQADISAPAPIESCSADVVVCQNVLECLDDPQALLGECHRLLKPGGSLLLAHHDFDSIVLNSETRDLTHRLIHLYSDHCQEWQERADGQIGRRLPGIVSRSAFNDPVTETVTFVDLDMNAGTYARDQVELILETASREGIEPTELSSWLAHLEDLDRKGEFYFSIQWTWVKAVK